MNQKTYPTALLSPSSRICPLFGRLLWASAFLLGVLPVAASPLALASAQQQVIAAVVGAENSVVLERKDLQNSDQEISWVDMRIRVRPMREEPSLESDTSVAFYFTPRGQLRVNSGGDWQDADVSPVKLNEWQRIVTKMDYKASPQTWSIWLNGEPAGKDLLFANRVDQFEKITFGNEVSTDFFLDRLEIGAGEPVIAPVAKVARTAPPEKPKIAPSVSPDEKKKVAAPPAREAAESTPAEKLAGSAPTLPGGVEMADGKPMAPAEAADPAVSAAARSGDSQPAILPYALFLVPIAAFSAWWLQRRSPAPKCPPRGSLIAFGILSGIALGLFFAFPQAESGLPPFLGGLAALLALFLGGFGFYLARNDQPEEISILFRYASFVGCGGLLLVSLGFMLDPAIGVGIATMGMIAGMVGCWMFADSGIRGARSFFAGVLGAVAAPAIVFQQFTTGGLILVVSLASLPLFFLMRDARRKYKREEEHYQVEKRGSFKHPVVVGDNDSGTEEVVVVRKKKKQKAKRKGRSRADSRLSSAQRPVVISRDATEEEEGVPFFGEGVLATEPGRKGDVQIDPWTGAAVPSGQEPSSSEEEAFQSEEQYSEGESYESDEDYAEMEQFDPDEEFPEMQSLAEDEDDTETEFPESEQKPEEDRTDERGPKDGKA